MRSLTQKMGTKLLVVLIGSMPVLARAMPFETVSAGELLRLIAALGVGLAILWSAVAALHWLLHLLEAREEADAAISRARSADRRGRKQ